MSKKMIFAVVFSLALSMMVTQEVNALTIGTGIHVGSNPRFDPNKVCGNVICQPGDNYKWSSAILASQREGHGKATGGSYGYIIMHQLVVNSLVKTSQANSMTNASNSSINSTG
jgi:hypothetical protein